MPNADDLSGEHVSLLPPSPPSLLNAPMIQAPLAPMEPLASTGADKPRYQPSSALNRPVEVKLLAPKRTNGTLKNVMLAVVVLIVAGLGYIYSFIQESRKAAEEALIKRRRGEEQSAQQLKAHNEWIEKLNAEMRRQGQKMEEEQRREEAERDESAKREARRGNDDGPLAVSTGPRSVKVNAIDREQFASDDTMREVASAMPLYKSGTPKSHLIAGTARAPWMKTPVGEWPQILLTNEITFNGHTSMSGASSFIVEVDGGSRWLISAEPIIGEDGGVDPPLVAEELDGALRQWKAFPPLAPQNFLTAKGTAPGMSNATCFGILAVRLGSSGSIDLPVKALKLSKRRVANGEVLYLVGLPFYDGIHPQNIYTCTVGRFAGEERAFRVSIDAEVMCRGFSGAPVIDANGEVVGIVTNGYAPAATKVVEAIVLDAFIGH